MKTVGFAIALAAASMAAAVELPPQAIHAPFPISPWETRNLQTTPTATVELKIGPRGQVTSVEVTALHPSTSADAVFRKTLKETLGTWRYAPAIRDGKPVDGVVKMQVQFNRAAGQSEMPTRIPDFAIGFMDADDPTAAAWAFRVDGMDSAGYLEARKQLIASIEALVATGKRRELAAGDVRVITDSEIPEVTRIVGNNINAVNATLAGLFRNVGPLEQPRAPLAAYVFHSESPVLAAASGTGVTMEAAGLYSPFGVLLFHLELPSSEAVRHVQLHETTHAFTHRHLVRRGVRWPMWLEEGLAEYVGNSDVEQGKLKPGSHKPYMVYHSGASAWRGRSTTSVDAATVKTAIKNSTSVPIAKLLVTSGSQFYGTSWQLYYTQSWLFVHFLRHGQPGWSEAQFPAFLLYASEGFPVEDAVRQVYGLDGEALETAFRSYVAKF